MKRLPRELLERLARLEERRAPDLIARLERMTRHEMVREMERLEAEIAADGGPRDLAGAERSFRRRHGRLPPIAEMDGDDLALACLRLEAEIEGRPAPFEGRPVPVPEESR